MKTYIKSDVIVIGAGPAGLTIACELRLAGLRVAVLERRSAPVAQSRALTMHGRTVEMLALRGVAERFIGQGMKIRTGHFASLDTRLDFSGIDTAFPYTLFIPQSMTEHLLEAWAVESGVALYRGTVAEQIAQTKNGVLVKGARDGKTLGFSAPYLIGADGARSMVRETAGIAFEGHAATRTVMMGDVHMSAPPPEGALSLESEAGGLMIVPMGGDLYRAIVINPERMHVPVSEALTQEELSASMRQVAGQDFGMHEPLWLSRFSNESRLAERYRQDRVFLVGDAAHMHFPAGGQGMNVGMQDAMNLGWKLAGVVNGLVSESLLDSYHAERHEVGAALVQNTMAQSSLLLNSFDPEGQALRRTFSALLKLPALNHTLAQDLSGFGIAYSAPLGGSVGGWAPVPGWTGRRVPDWPLLDRQGKLLSLYTLMQDGKWLLLRITEAGARFTPDLDPRWVTIVHAALDRRDERLNGVDAVLLRPDGHVDQAVRVDIG